MNNQILDVNFPQLISSKDQFDTECQRIVRVMIQRGFFQAARDLSTAAKLNSDHVTLSEVSLYGYDDIAVDNISLI